MFKSLFVLPFALTLGCSAADETDETFTDCAIGELTGTWRTHYTETDGNCGAIPDETTVFNPNATAPGCVYQSSTISDDKCRAEMDFTCPTTDDAGSQHWVLVVTQTGTGTLDGTGTVQISHSTLGSCRSTYDLGMSRL